MPCLFEIIITGWPVSQVYFRKLHSWYYEWTRLNTGTVTDCLMCFISVLKTRWQFSVMYMQICRAGICWILDSAFHPISRRCVNIICLHVTNRGRLNKVLKCVFLLKLSSSDFVMISNPWVNHALVLVAGVYEHNVATSNWVNWIC